MYLREGYHFFFHFGHLRQHIWAKKRRFVERQIIVPHLKTQSLLIMTIHSQRWIYITVYALYGIHQHYSISKWQRKDHKRRRLNLYETATRFKGTCHRDSVDHAGSRNRISFHEYLWKKQNKNANVYFQETSLRRNLLSRCLTTTTEKIKITNKTLTCRIQQFHSFC